MKTSDSNGNGNGNAPNPGAYHPKLKAEGPAPFRPNRVPTATLSRRLSCYFRSENNSFGPLDVLDASPTGLGVRPEAGVSLPPGTRLEDLLVCYGDVEIFRGSASVVHQIGPPHGRLGIRMTSDVLDMDRLQVGDRLAQALSEARQFRHSLPEAWRAAVAEVRQLLEAVRGMMNASDGPLPPAEEIQRAVETVHEEFGPELYSLLSKLHTLSAPFDRKARGLGRAYATRELLDIVRAGPMHQRAYEKPRKYAGDYLMMTLYFTSELQGDTPFARLLHYTAQHYTLGRTVVQREKNMRAVVSEVAAKKGRSRIVSLACGPAIELESLIRDHGRELGEAEFILVDQDAEALEYATGRLNKVLLQHHRGQLPVTLRPVYLSVSQLLEPLLGSDQQFVDSVLSGVDLVYAAGLLDYLPDDMGRALLSRLWRMLRPGGRLFIGNLKEAPDTTWMMEYVLSWHLHYRTEESLRGLGRLLDPPPAAHAIVPDATGHCIFLDATRPCLDPVA